MKKYTTYELFLAVTFVLFSLFSFLWSYNLAFASMSFDPVAPALDGSFITATCTVGNAFYVFDFNEIETDFHTDCLTGVEFTDLSGPGLYSVWECDSTVPDSLCYDNISYENIQIDPGLIGSDSYFFNSPEPTPMTVSVFLGYFLLMFLVCIVVGLVIENFTRLMSKISL